MQNQLRVILRITFFFCLTACGSHPGQVALAQASVIENEVDLNQDAADAKPAQSPTITAKSWYSAMQKVAMKYRKGANGVENDLRFVKLREGIAKEFDNASITFRVKIKRIDWRNGVASLTLAWPLPSNEPGNAFSLVFTGLQPIELEMDEQQAATLKPGNWLTFTGLLKLRSGQYGSVGVATKSQQLFTVTHHNLLPGHFIGTFTSVDYDCENRWAEV